MVLKMRESKRYMGRTIESWKKSLDKTQERIWLAQEGLGGESDLQKLIAARDKALQDYSCAKEHRERVLGAEVNA